MPNPTGSVNGAAAFNYGTHLDSPSATPTMSMMTATYREHFKSRVLSHDYPEGVYSLKESFDPACTSAQYSVWQYYLFDKVGVLLKPKSVSESFVTQPIMGVDKVIWRLITILGGPTSPLNPQETMVVRHPKVRAVGM